MRIKQFILLLVVMFCCCFFIQYTNFNDDYLSLLLIVPGLLVGFLFSIIIHELGHLVFGLLSGYKFISFKVLFIRVFKKDGYKISFEKGFLTMPGQCLMKPTNHNYFLYNIGGLIFTYLFSIFLLLLFYLNDNSYLIQFIFGIFIINTLLGVMNSVYNKEGINDVCNIIRCRKNKDYLEAMLYQLDIVANVSLKSKFKSKYNPSDSCGNVIIDVSVYRFKYLKAFNEKNIGEMERYYILLKRKYNSINLGVLRVSILIMLLNHEFMIKKDVLILKNRLNRMKKKDLLLLKKFNEENMLVEFYLNNVIGKLELNDELFKMFLIKTPVDLFEKINNKTYLTIYNMYLAYVRNGFVFN